MTEPPPMAGAEMSQSAVESLLDGIGHGVLSLGKGDRGYGLPITYWYDRSDHRLVVGFLLVPDSKKTEYATQSERVTLTVFDFEDVDIWESVIVTGTLERIEDPNVPDRFTTLFFVRDEDGSDGRTAYDWDQYERAWYRIDIEEMRGRSSGTGTID